MSYSDELLKESLLTEESILQDLRTLSLYYDDMQTENKILPSLEDAPLPTLLAGLDADDKERPRMITHSFLPVDKEEAEFTKYLQFYLELQNTLKGIARITLLEAVCRLNAALPFGHVMLIPPRPELNLPEMAALRTTQGFPIAQPIDQGTFTENVFLFDLSCELTSTVLDALAEGKSIDEAFAAIGR